MSVQTWGIPITGYSSPSAAQRRKFERMYPGAAARFAEDQAEAVAKVDAERAVVVAAEKAKHAACTHAFVPTNVSGNHVCKHCKLWVPAAVRVDCPVRALTTTDGEIMTDEEADDFMREHDWAKWSDCRSMVQAAHFQGHKDAQEGFRRMSVIAVAKAIAAEREACAVLCDAGVDTPHPPVAGGTS